MKSNAIFFNGVGQVKFIGYASLKCGWVTSWGVYILRNYKSQDISGYPVQTKAADYELLGRLAADSRRSNKKVHNDDNLSNGRRHVWSS